MRVSIRVSDSASDRMSDRVSDRVSIGCLLISATAFVSYLLVKGGGKG